MGKNVVPQWYVAMENERIIGGMGVIENDFHDRKDLTPNVCAVYTEADKRCNRIAGALLNYVCNDMKANGRNKALTYEVDFFAIFIDSLVNYEYNVRFITDNVTDSYFIGGNLLRFVQQ